MIIVPRETLLFYVELYFIVSRETLLFYMKLYFIVSRETSQKIKKIFGNHIESPCKMRNFMLYYEQFLI